MYPPPGITSTTVTAWYLLSISLSDVVRSDFFSSTQPGVTRGDHFHLSKIERFVVVEGEAIIRIRKALGDDVWSRRVSGSVPEAIDMPTLHSHSLENVGQGPLLTLFWADRPFNPERPDTFADRVLP